MGRVGSLTADPLRLAEPAAVALAVHRLDRAASLADPLQTAERSLTLLTCLRLEALSASRRGEDALAAALARYAETENEELASPARARSAQPARTGRAAVATAPHSTPARTTRRPLPPREQRRVSSATTSRGPAAARRVEPRLGATAPAGSSEPAASPAEATVCGLEWLTDGRPGATEAAATALQLAAPVDEDVEPLRPAVVSAPRSRTPAAAGPRTAREAPVPDPAIAEPRAFAAASLAEGAAVAETAPTAAASRRTPLAGRDGELATLVRAWESAVEEDEPGAPPEPPSAPAERAALAVEPSAAPAAPPAAVRARAGEPARTPAPVDELLGLGDEIGRVLVAELRRYGIEVGA